MSNKYELTPTQIQITNTFIRNISKVGSRKSLKKCVALHEHYRNHGNYIKKDVTSYVLKHFLQNNKDDILHSIAVHYVGYDFEPFYMHNDDFKQLMLDNDCVKKSDIAQNEVNWTFKHVA